MQFVGFVSSISGISFASPVAGEPTEDAGYGLARCGAVTGM